ncbi:DUF5134 domain-containing protein [Streptomyces lunalinharesii]|uniref:DUF5134 domain-containing protein n=1 Tax=Streptomyces lunalinharesii TaxID=333384 RepID=A0ABN3RQI5_9ACTN
MIAATGLRWLLSALFALPALYGLWSGLAPGKPATHRVDHLLHAAMGLAMIAMVWPWGMDLPAGPQVVLFVAGALWFAGAALFRADASHRAKASLAALPHVVMMGAMAWMVAAMDPSGMTATGGGGAMADMPGMDMSASVGAATMHLTGTGQRLAAVLLAVVLAVVALRWLAHAFDVARSGRADGSEAAVRHVGGALDPACHAAMGLGMAVMFALMA